MCEVIWYDEVTIRMQYKIRVGLTPTFVVLLARAGMQFWKKRMMAANTARWQLFYSRRADACIALLYRWDLVLSEPASDQYHGSEPWEGDAVAQ